MKNSSLKNDDSLIESMQKGDERAFRHIYDKYLSFLYHLALKSTQQVQLSEEIVQDVFVRLWNKRETLNPQGSLKAYLWKSCRHRIFDYWKKEAKRLAVEKEASYGRPLISVETENTVLFAEYEGLVHEAVQQLPPRRKQIFQLCSLEGKTYEEVAVQFGLTRSTVHDHMVKSIRSIKDHLHLSADISLVWFMVVCVF
uniref:RNA polymerase sigma-70 factor n=1 Tax=Roseihalotalea indica TaxID=2867963 RepID=A0AA49GPE3_9BACT|nr:RNA polymerase sigma-70 factor [Tunicatimonas sp. TK19036]